MVVDQQQKHLHLNLFERALGTMPGEGIVTVAAFIGFYSIITSYYVLKPLREGLAIEFGAERIPMLQVFSVFSLIGANAAYSWFMGRFSRRKLVPRILLAFVICLAIFWGFFQLIPPQAEMGRAISSVRAWAIGSYFLWVNLFGLFAVSMFWSVLNDTFSKSQGKRLYSVIGSGGLLGGLSGSSVTAALVSTVGTANLFLVAAGLLVPSIVCVEIIQRWSEQQGGMSSETPDQPAPKTNGNFWDGFSILSKSSILTLLAIEVFLYTFCSSLFSYQMNKLIESELSTTDERTLLIAGIYNAISVMSIIFQFLLTRRILNWRVPLYGLLLIPLVQIAGSSAMLLKSSLFLGALVVVIRYALNYSVGRSVRELIYTPLSQPEKFEGKAFIDTLVFRTGDGSASLLLLVILHVLPVGSMVNGLILVGMIGSILIISKLNQRVQSQEERGEADTLPAGNR